MKSTTGQELKETKEVFNAATETFLTGQEIFEDGKVNFADLGAIFPLLGEWQEGIEGLKVGFPGEASLATPADVDDLFTPIEDALAQTMAPLLAKGVISQFKAAYSFYAFALQQKEVKVSTTSGNQIKGTKKS